MKTLLLVIFYWLVPFFSFGQEKIIRGIVENENGLRLEGVHILLSNASFGTSTNQEGYYEIRVPKTQDSLTFTLIGFQPRKVSISDQRFVNIVLVEILTVIDTIEISGFPRVTTLARRRLENIQAIPESIIGQNSIDIENFGIENIPDFITFVPNASFISNQNIGTHALSVRGISQLRNGEPPVALVVDGVNVPNPSGLDQKLFDIEQIELIKGPQGALYGRNAIGGALNITTRRPSNSSRNFVNFGYANGHTFHTVIGSTGPIIKEKLLYRLAASYKSSDGIIENSFTNQKVDPYADLSLRGQLFLEFTPEFTGDIIANYAKTTGGAAYYIIGCDPTLNSLGGCHTNTEVLTADNTTLEPIPDEVGDSEREIKDLSLRLNYGFSFGRLTSVTAVHQFDVGLRGDLDFSPLRELLQDQQLAVDGFSQEIRLTSNSDQKLRWIFGGFYQNLNRELNTLATLSSAGIFAGLFGFPQTSLSEEVLYPIIEANEANDNTTGAFFGQLQVDLGDKTELSVGIRFDRDRRQQTNLSDQTARKHTFKKWQPKINLSHHLNDHLFGFVSYSQGYRSGGFNAPTIIRYPELFNAEQSNNYEIGFKSNWKENRLLINLSSFYIDFKETQIFLLELDGGGQIIVNLGKTRNIGAELDLKYQLAKNLVLSCGLSAINPKILEIGNSIPDSLASRFNFSDNYVPFVNVNNTFLSLLHTIPLNADNKLQIHAFYEHRGKMYWHPDNFDVQPSKDFVNLSLKLLHSGKRSWSVAGYVKNLFDADYSGEYVAVEFSGAFFGDLRWPGNPRTCGMQFKLDF